MIFDVRDVPKFSQLVIFALQQMLAILAATIAVPLIIGNGLTPSAAMFGAGAGTLIYIIITRQKSPVFLGSSFAFIGSMSAAFAGGRIHAARYARAADRYVLGGAGICTYRAADKEDRR
jgi:uracil permease